MTTQPPKILVVDSDEVQRTLTTTLLESAGFAVVAANHALAAVEVARGDHPDLILTDVLLGEHEIDGFGLCRRLHDDPQLAAIPVVLISAHQGGRRDQELARQVGALALVERSDDFASELIAVKACLNEHRRGRSAGSVLMLTSDANYEQVLTMQATKLTQLADQKRHTEQRLQALLEGSHATFAVTTHDGIVIEANVRWQTLLGIEPGSMVGQPIEEFVEQNDLRASGVVPLRHTTSGKTVFVEFSIIQLADEELIVGHDVTARIEAELRSASAEAHLRKATDLAMQHTFVPLEDFDDTAVTRPIQRMR